MPSKYPNSGTLGTNRRKENENHPGYTGQAEIDGTEYWISGWVKEGKDGKFFSLSFKPKEEKPRERTIGGDEDEANDIPF